MATAVLFVIVTMVTSDMIVVHAQQTANIDANIITCAQHNLIDDRIEFEISIQNLDSHAYTSIGYTIFLHDENGVKLASQNGFTHNAQPQLTYYESSTIRYSGTWSSCSIEVTSTRQSTPLPASQANIDANIITCAQHNLIDDRIEFEISIQNLDSHAYTSIGYTIFLHDENGVKLTSQNGFTHNAQPQLTYYESSTIRYPGTWSSCSIEVTSTRQSTPLPASQANIDANIITCAQHNLIDDRIEFEISIQNLDSHAYTSIGYTIFLHDENGVKLTSQNGFTHNAQPQLTYYESSTIRYPGTWSSCSIEVTSTRPLPQNTPNLTITVTPTQTTSTEGTPITLTASAQATSGIAGISWHYQNGTTIGTGTSITFTPTTTGTYTIGATASDNNGNQETSYATITVNTPSPPPPPPSTDVINLLLNVTDGLALQIAELESKFVELSKTSAGQTTPAIIDSGDFIPIYYDATTNYNLVQKQYFQDQLFLERFTDRLTETLVLPYDVYLTMDECGASEAFYNPNDKEIVICYEFITFLEDVLYPYYDTDAELFQQIDEFAAWVMLHELGHALVDVYDLPITGKEEDAVDQFATIISLEYIPEGQLGSDLYPTLLTWAVLGQDDAFSTGDQRGGQHSLSSQRFYNVACWMYGSDVLTYGSLVDLLPVDRYVRCPSEYEIMSKSWYKIVSPFLINQESVPPPKSIPSQ